MDYKCRIFGVENLEPSIIYIFSLYLKQKLRENPIRFLIGFSILCHMSRISFWIFILSELLLQLNFLNFAAKHENQRDYNAWLRFVLFLHFVYPCTSIWLMYHHSLFRKFTIKWFALKAEGSFTNAWLLRRNSNFTLQYHC